MIGHSQRFTSEFYYLLNPSNINISVREIFSSAVKEADLFASSPQSLIIRKVEIVDFIILV